MQRDADNIEGDAAGLGELRRILSKVEQSDFERIDPPASVWEQIEASVASDRATTPRTRDRPPTEPPSRNVAPSTIVEYWIDADDVVAEVGEHWADFARNNDAAELALPASDRTLWSYFDGGEVRELWQLLVTHVRASQTLVRVPLRCDAPDARRWFDMTITAEPNGRVYFRCALVFEESRPPVALLDPHSERDDGARSVALCSWCGRGQRGSAWLDIEELVQAARLLERESVPQISHGICGACRQDMSSALLVTGGGEDISDS